MSRVEHSQQISVSGAARPRPEQGVPRPESAAIEAPSGWRAFEGLQLYSLSTAQDTDDAIIADDRLMATASTAQEHRVRIQVAPANATSSARVQRLRSQAKALYAGQRVRFPIRLLDAGQANLQFTDREGTELEAYIVSSIPGGIHLYSIGDRHPWADVKPVVIDLLEQMAHLHGDGVWGFPLDPWDLQTQNGRVISIGLHTALSQDRAESEPSDDSETSPQADLRRLGRLMYALLTGGAATDAPLPEEDSADTDVQSLPTDAREVLRRLLAADQRHRASTADQLLHMLTRSAPHTPDVGNPIWRQLIAAARAIPHQQFSLQQLTELFDGPTDYVHIPMRAASELLRRTGGLARCVVAELCGWQKLDAARWTEDGRLFKIEAPALRVLERDAVLVDLRVFPAPAQLTGLGVLECQLLRRVWMAWPFSSLATLEATFPPDQRASLDGAVVQLQRAGAIQRLPDGSLYPLLRSIEAYTTDGAAHTSDEPSSPEIHRGLADAPVIRARPEARIRHLVAAEQLEVALQLARQEAAIRRHEGQTERGFALLRELVTLIRATGEASIGEDIWRELVLCALVLRQRAALAEVEHLLAGVPQQPLRLRAMRCLVRAARFQTGPEPLRTIAILQVEKPWFPDDLELELWCYSVRITHFIKVDDLFQETRVIASAHQRFSGHDHPLVLYKLDAWEAEFAYRTGRTARAEELYRRALRHAGSVNRADVLGTRLNLASVLMELGTEAALTEARELAQMVLDEADLLRLPTHQVRADWIERTAAYRIGSSGPSRTGRVQVARAIGGEAFAGLLALTEAAYAFRGQDKAAARTLCTIGRDCIQGDTVLEIRLLFGALAAWCELPTLKADSKWVLTALETERCVDPLMRLETLGLIAMTGMAPAGSCKDAFLRLKGRCLDVPWESRRNVLSLREASEAIEAYANLAIDEQVSPQGEEMATETQRTNMSADEASIHAILVQLEPSTQGQTLGGYVFRVAGTSQTVEDWVWFEPYADAPAREVRLLHLRAEDLADAEHLDEARAARAGSATSGFVVERLNISWIDHLPSPMELDAIRATQAPRLARTTALPVAGSPAGAKGGARPPDIGMHRCSRLTRTGTAVALGEAFLPSQSMETSSGERSGMTQEQHWVVSSANARERAEELLIQHDSGTGLPNTVVEFLMQARTRYPSGCYGYGVRSRGTATRVAGTPPGDATLTGPQINVLHPGAPLPEGAERPAQPAGWRPRPGSTREAALADMFVFLLQDSQSMLQWARSLPSGAVLAQNLPGRDVAPGQYAHELAYALNRWGMVDPALFLHLRDRLPPGAGGTIAAAAQYVGVQLPAEATEHVRVLMLMANPMDTGRIDLAEEAREIRMELRAASLRDAFTFQPEPAVRIGDLPRLLREVRPTVLHFSGHGVNDGLVMQSRAGHTSVLSPNGLAGILDAVEQRPKLVILNACYSAEQARALMACTDSVVGMRGQVDDEAARTFAAYFYQGIADGATLRSAFKSACATIRAEKLRDADAPHLWVDTEGRLDAPLVRR